MEKPGDQANLITVILESFGSRKPLRT